MAILYHNTTSTYSHRLKIILTFECNFTCEYCAIEYALWKDRKHKCRIRTPDEWANAINKVERRGIVFNGGEPSRYPNLYKLLGVIRSDIGVSLYTNMSFDVREFAQNVGRRMGFLLSYHPQYGSVEEFIENFRILQECERFSFVLHGVKIEKERDEYVERKFAEAGIRFHLEDDCNEVLKERLPAVYREYPRRVICQVKNYVFAPDGSRYPCACRAYRLDNPLWNICDGKPLGPEIIAVECDDFGMCHLADIQENVTMFDGGEYYG